MNYPCPKCKKEFKYQSLLKDHLNRKKPCNKLKEELKCNLCNVIFLRPKHQEIHDKTQKHLNKVLEYSNEKNRTSYADALENIRKLMNVTQMNQFLNTDVTSIDVNKLTNIISDSRTVNAIKFLKEDYHNINHLDDDYPCIDFILCLIKILKELNFSTKNPQNHNCKILAFYDALNNEDSCNKYLILDKDLQNLFYWNEISYEEFLNLLLKLMNLVNNHFNIVNLNYIIIYLNKYFKNNIILYQKIKKDIMFEMNSITNICKSKKNNFNFKEELANFISINTKLPNGDQPNVKFKL